mmetsp:Transcript_42568/g.109930  ORF Transcript_42568/g.109930 Transcript_42568/m.109930 type:complete len:204 (+) Transcript_42568:262-873(+)
MIVVPIVRGMAGSLAAQHPAAVFASTASTAQSTNCARKNRRTCPGTYAHMWNQLTASHMYSWKSPDIKKARKPPRCRSALERLRTGVKKVLFIRRWMTRFHRRPQKSRMLVDCRSGCLIGSTVSIPIRARGTLCISMAVASMQYTKAACSHSVGREVGKPYSVMDTGYVPRSRKGTKSVALPMLSSTAPASMCPARRSAISVN